MLIYLLYTETTGHPRSNKNGLLNSRWEYRAEMGVSPIHASLKSVASLSPQVSSKSKSSVRRIKQVKSKHSFSQAVKSSLIIKSSQVKSLSNSFFSNVCISSNLFFRVIFFKCKKISYVMNQLNMNESQTAFYLGVCVCV